MFLPPSHFPGGGGAHLGVHGSAQDQAVADPDDGGGGLGVVGVAGEVEVVARPQAHHRGAHDHRVIGGNCRGRKGEEGGVECATAYSVER